MKTKNEIIKEIKGQILIGGGETLVEAIYEIMNREMSQQKEESLLEGEKSMARAVLRRTEKGRSLEHIKVLCEAVLRLKL